MRCAALVSLQFQSSVGIWDSEGVLCRLLEQGRTVDGWNRHVVVVAVVRCWSSHDDRGLVLLLGPTGEEQQRRKEDMFWSFRRQDCPNVRRQFAAVVGQAHEEEEARGGGSGHAAPQEPLSSILVGKCGNSSSATATTTTRHREKIEGWAALGREGRCQWLGRRPAELGVPFARLGVACFLETVGRENETQKGSFQLCSFFDLLYIWMNSSNHELLHDACLTKSCSPGHNERGDARDKRFCCFRLIYAHV